MQTAKVPIEGSEAQRQIMKDLMDALLFEELIPLDDRVAGPLAARPELAPLFNGSGSSLVYDGALRFLFEPGIRQRHVWDAASPVYVRNGEGGWRQTASPREACEAVFRAVLSPEAFARRGTSEFLEGLDIAARQLELSLERTAEPLGFAPQTPFAWLLKGERIASLRDRPFHPLAKAKIGLSDEDYAACMAEFGRPAAMRWVAVKQESIQRGSLADEAEPLDLLDGRERAAVEAELAHRRLSEAGYMALPVHPWQLEHKIKPEFGDEIADGTIVVLDVEAGRFLATSSIRTFASPDDPERMLKLPLSVLSLGAARYLPVVKLLNGLAGERMFREALARDAALADRVFLCEERNWWGFLPEPMGLFDDRPRHLAAQIRKLPAEALAEGRRAVPMASLGVQRKEGHFLSELLGKDVSAEEAAAFYEETAELFYDIVMRLFKIGIVPEIHGQNCCLVLSGNRPHGLLFRDHDSVRLHPAYLERHGIGDPLYRIRPGYSNSLYNETPEKLIFYVQSLGTQVNLASILESLAAAYGIPERRLWRSTESAWRKAFAAAGLPEQDRGRLERAIFESEEWPLKQIVVPLLESDGVPGAMPSGKGTGANPFQLLRRSHFETPLRSGVR
ncbi:IucA/IucC family protein [Paenibacillus pasadenensis]|nr:IucA/IucC family protein [Paenibacillus sp. B01]QGG58806.1 IucA/IucC family siderophore biosynthesis protein [Paenibacillus sp. B01]